MKDIAFQAGVSLATVDRVLHGRAGVRAGTQARVVAAIGELERQYAAAGLSGRKFAIDVVMEAPRRFAQAVQQAFEAELPAVRPAAFSARFHVAERMAVDDLAAVLAAIRRRGSHGIVLKVPARDETVQLAQKVLAAGIPVVTYVTDLPVEARQAYLGMDNQAAGQSAAWLIGHMLGARDCAVLLVLSSARFMGEEARAQGFRAALAEHFPGLRVVVVSEGMGVDRSTYELVAAALVADPKIEAVYSIGGGNRAILRAFDECGRRCRAFAAHDLDAKNRELLHKRHISFVLHHDLRQDARAACQFFLRAHGMLPGDYEIPPSAIGIATPFSLAGP
ncbi:MAG: LacI family DNA-binding transcriptional regulator [Pseudorhodobacter sp.]